MHNSMAQSGQAFKTSEKGNKFKIRRKISLLGIQKINISERQIILDWIKGHNDPSQLNGSKSKPEKIYV